MALWEPTRRCNGLKGRIWLDLLYHRPFCSMAFLFDSFDGWKKYSDSTGLSLVDVVLEYEHAQKGRSRESTM
jgi:hypothetical protein